jgi:hypothetical protein
LKFPNLTIVNDILINPGAKLMQPVGSPSG